MRVFVAGATGVIGTQLVPQLVDAGHEVTAMTRSVLRAAQLEATGANPVVCDVFDADAVSAAMADASPAAVIHQLTALPPRLDWGDPSLFDGHKRGRRSRNGFPSSHGRRAEPPAVAKTLPPPHTLEMSLRGTSNAKAKRELGWRPRHASWREGFGASLA